MKKFLIIQFIFSIFFSCSIFSQYAHNIYVGPFLSLTPFFNIGIQKTVKARIINIGTSNETGIPVKCLVNGTQVGSINMNLNAGTIDSVSFDWVPADTGTKILKVISSLASDQYRANDTVTATVTVFPTGVFNASWGTGTIEKPYPFITSYMAARTQIVYTAAQISLGAPRSIQKIGFNVAVAYPQVMNGFSIKMQNSSLTLLNGFISSGWTEVFNGTYSVPETGWQFITLATPFNYDGTSSLLVELCFSNSYYTSSSTVFSTFIIQQTWVQGGFSPNYNSCTDFAAGYWQVSKPNVCFQGIITGVNNHQQGIPTEFSLSQNYPNPFNPITDIKYSIPKETNVKITIYDELGREVAVLVIEKQNAGNYNVEWDGTNYSSGLYFYKLEAGDFTDVKKMVLIK
jgi:hypothetical protein